MQPPPRPRRRGKPGFEDDPKVRTLYVRIADRVLIDAWTRHHAAIVFGVSYKTACRAVERAPGLPEGEHLADFA